MINHIVMLKSNIGKIHYNVFYDSGKIFRYTNSNNLPLSVIRFILTATAETITTNTGSITRFFNLSDSKYKMRVYYTSGVNKGNLHYELYFFTYEAMIQKYEMLFKYELYALNPTLWEKDENNDFFRIFK